MATVRDAAEAVSGVGVSPEPKSQKHDQDRDGDTPSVLAAFFSLLSSLFSPPLNSSLFPVFRVNITKKRDGSSIRELIA